jgi:hypothetical protein
MNHQPDLPILLIIDLVGKSPVPFWDFQHTDALITQGYEIVRRALEMYSDKCVQTVQV